MSARLDDDLESARQLCLAVAESFTNNALKAVAIMGFSVVPRYSDSHSRIERNLMMRFDIAVFYNDAFPYPAHADLRNALELSAFTQTNGLWEKVAQSANTLRP